MMAAVCAPKGHGIVLPRRLSALLLAATIATIAAPSLAAGKSTPSLYHCPVGNGHGYGYPPNTRVTSLTIRYGEGISCSYAWAVARKNGHSPKLWKCTSKLLDTHAHYYDRQLTCTHKEPPNSVLWVRWTVRKSTH
jgi:hypothetical protein